MKAIHILLITLLVFTFSGTDAQTPSQRQNLIIRDNLSQLDQIKTQIRSDQNNKRTEALRLASENGWKIKKNRNGRLVELQKVSTDGTPLYYTTYNLNAAQSSGASSLWSGGSSGLNLNGEAMTLGIWDGAAVRTSHREFGGRVVLVDGISFSGSNGGTEHATHVAGTMIASGVLGTAKGMAPAAQLRASDWNFDESEMLAFGSAGFLISNHSYGFSTEAQDGWPDWRFGYYDDTAENWDEIAFAAPHYLIVKASGNDLNDGKNPSRGGYDLLEGAGTAKNVLVVGAVEDVLNYFGPGSVSLSDFSSTGPTDDGRIKPDLVGNGVNLRSTYSGSDIDYESISGTSMASPNVSGSSILLQQHYNNLNSTFMRSATLRGLLIHTAKEAGPSPGPDYRFGWGLIDVESAAEIITENGESTLIEEQVLINGESFQKIVVADGLSPLTVTICWTDPKGTPLPDGPNSQNSTSSLLVNDLDSKLTKGSDTFLPWVLDPQNLSASATQEDNFRDNVEKIEISNPEFGEYIITINHKGTLANNAQAFSLIVSGVVPSSCNPTKPGNFMVNDITDNSAIISWDPQLGVNNYNGRYREKGTADWVGFSTTNNFYTLTDLLAGTIYQVEMQSLCSVVDLSAFSDPFSFQTECRPDVPANITFDNITTSSIHLAWDSVRAIESYEVRYRFQGGVWESETVTQSDIQLTNLLAGELYEFQVQSNCTAESTSSFSSSTTFTPYCIASGQSSENEWIERIQLGSIDNQSGNNGGYADFSTWSTVLQRGATTEIALQAGQVSSFPKYWSIWIDLNQNGVFSDPGENVLTATVEEDELTIHQFDIPQSALPGSTLLRVSMKYNENPGPCEAYAYGETEDYTVEIKDDIDGNNFIPLSGKSASNPTFDQVLAIYPNPSAAEISLNLSPELQGQHVSVLDMSGDVLISIPFESRMIIDITSLNMGVYLVRIETKSGAQMTRFIKN